MPAKQRKYLGETPVDLTKHLTYSRYTPTDWALLWILKYGSIDGECHKTWVIDQITQILNGTPMTAWLVRWDDGLETLRFSLGEPSIQYLQWMIDSRVGSDGPETYKKRNQGIAP